MNRSTEELSRLLAECPAPGGTWRHKATGNLYRVVGRCLIEASCDAAVVYQSHANSLTWCRPLTEWSEKFERLEE